MTTIRTILHPTDLSEPSKKAFQLACSLAQDHGARVIVLHVLEEPAIAYAAGVAMAPPPAPAPSEERKALEAELAELKPASAEVPVEYRLLQGDPTAGILAVAREQDCDLIAMGTHGRTGLGRLLMGSVAENVLHEANCPVLTVKTPAASE